MPRTPARSRLRVAEETEGNVPSTPPSSVPSGVSPVGRRTRSARKKNVETPVKTSAKTPAKTPAKTARSTRKKAKKEEPIIPEEEVIIIATPSTPNSIISDNNKEKETFPLSSNISSKEVTKDHPPLATKDETYYDDEAKSESKGVNESQKENVKVAPTPRRSSRRKSTVPQKNDDNDDTSISNASDSKKEKEAATIATNRSSKEATKDPSPLSTKDKKDDDDGKQQAESKDVEKDTKETVKVAPTPRSSNKRQSTAPQKNDGKDDSKDPSPPSPTAPSNTPQENVPTTPEKGDEALKSKDAQKADEEKETINTTGKNKKGNSGTNEKDESSPKSITTPTKPQGSYTSSSAPVTPKPTVSTTPTGATADSTKKNDKEDKVTEKITCTDTNTTTEKEDPKEATAPNTSKNATQRKRTSNELLSEHQQGPKKHQEKVDTFTNQEGETDIKTGVTTTPDTKKKKGSHSSEMKQSNRKRKQPFDSSSPGKRNHQYQSKQQPPKLLDVAVHRLRNLNLIPNGILCVASIPPPSPQCNSSLTSDPKVAEKESNNYVAISRNEGSVELLSVDERWRTKAIVFGFRNRNVDCLAWTTCGNTKKRLFGASRDGTIFELDFLSGQQTNVTGSGGGGVFALASLGGAGGGRGYLAAGCEDGSVRIYRTNNSSSTETAQDNKSDGEGGRIELISTLPSAGQAVLSIAWFRPPAGGGASADGIGGTILFAGAADGTIRRYDCIVDKYHRASSSSLSSPSSERQCRWRPTLRMTLENRGKRIPTRVWCLQVLNDGTIVSGDSLGLVQFWDGRAGTLIQKFEHNTQGADVLDLAVSLDQKKIFASGVDPLVACIERVPVPSSTYSSSSTATVSSTKWASTSGWRTHTHDVRGLAVVSMTDPLGSGGLATSLSEPRELLLSGGTDTKLGTYFVSDFKRWRPKSIYNSSNVSSPISLSRKKRVLAIMRSSNIDLYKLGVTGAVKPADGNPISMDEDEGRIGSITIDGVHNLSCCTISEDGSFLAASDAASLLLFRLNYVEDGGGGRAAVAPERIPLPRNVNRSCTALKFAVDGSLRLFGATSDQKVIVIKIHNASSSSLSHTREKGNDSKDIGKLNLNATLEHTLSMLPGGGSGFVPVTHLETTPDGMWLAAGRNAMGGGAVQIFALKLDDEANFTSYKHWWSVPATEAPTACLGFTTGGREKANAALVVGCSNNSFYIFDVQRKRMSDWSLATGFPMCRSLPRELTHRPECMERLAFDPSSPNKFLMAGNGFFCVVDLDRPVPNHSDIYPPNHVKAKRFKQEGYDKVQKMDQKKGMSNMTICLRYGGMLFLDFVGANEMVVVEQPWLSVVNSLPDALERKLYGR